MQWFGHSWGAPICREGSKVEVPVGEPCLWCSEAITADDQGVSTPYLGEIGTDWCMRPMHLDCQLRSILGGINHQRGDCTCCGGVMPPDPPELTLREAARQAANYRAPRTGLRRA